MPKLTANLVQETTSTVGTGTVSLAASTGWVRFSSRFSNNDRVYYSIRSGSDWEVGYGTYLSPNSLARTQVLETLISGTHSTSGTPVSLTGTSIVRAVAPEQMLTAMGRSEYTTIAASGGVTAGKLYGVTASSLALTLPAAAVAGDRIDFIQAASGVTGTTIPRNGHKIGGVAEDMAVNIANFYFSLIYIDSNYGWKVEA